MKVINEKADLRIALQPLFRAGKTVGFVPTMGALHAGHRSLIETARAEVDVVVVSIFVNPIQFGPAEDLQKYPRPFAQDVAMCEEVGVDFMFHPNVDHFYSPGFCTFVDVDELSTVFEGASRPHHFRGVTTVVMKLLNCVQPTVVYFGQKDFQQQLLIRRMCEDLDLPVEVRTCPTVREPDGLAMSSRNVYLSSEERQSAMALSHSLQQAQKLLDGGETNFTLIAETLRQQLVGTNGIQLDYLAIVDATSLQEISIAVPQMAVLVAASVGTTRLIDNCLLSMPS